MITTLVGLNLKCVSELDGKRCFTML